MAFSELFALKACLEANRLDSYYFSVVEVEIGVSGKGLGFPGGSVVRNPCQKMWIQSLGWEDPLEKEMATHSSILAWETPRTEEPGGLQSMRLLRHDLATKQLDEGTSRSGWRRNSRSVGQGGGLSGF